MQNEQSWCARHNEKMHLEIIDVDGNSGITFGKNRECNSCVLEKMRIVIDSQTGKPFPHVWS